MRKILASSVAAALIATGAYSTGAINTAHAAERGGAAQQDQGSAARDTTKNVPKRSKLGEPSDGLKALDPDPYSDPMYIDPDKNPFKNVSSSEMFLDWTKDMEPGEGKDFVQAWAVGSAVPDTANPVELLKQEIQGSSMMVNGLFTGDFAQSSRGSSQSSSVILTVLLGVFVAGQALELVMRGLRLAGVDIPAFTL